MSSIQIRMATDSDQAPLEGLWNYCFSDGEAFSHWYFRTYYRKEECLVATVDDVVAASLQVIDLPTRVGERVLKAGYIVGVNCLPEYRGMGLTRRLMDAALNEYAPSHGLEFLHLMPFEADFYLPYGFVFGDYHAQIDLPIEEFYNPEDRVLARAYRWQTVSFEDWQAVMALLEALYAEGTARYAGRVERMEQRRWQAFFEDLQMENGIFRVLYSADGRARGYLAYILKEDHLMVRECIALDGEARRVMYYYMASHRSQVKRVKWSAPENEPVVFRRQKDKGGVAFTPFMMYRLLDPTIIGVFASSLPSDDICFDVAGCGRYLWHGQSSRIERVGEALAEHSEALSLAALSALVFDRGAWEAGVWDSSLESASLAALFTNKARIFHNEYF